MVIEFECLLYQTEYEETRASRASWFELFKTFVVPI